MSSKIPTVIHRYDVADFTKYLYWQIYFAENATIKVNGSEIEGVAGLIIEIALSSKPIHISGSHKIYLLGSECACGPFEPAYTGSTNSDYPTGTKYYYGNIY